MRTADPVQAEARRQRIRQAALACFKRTGFHQTGMAEICKEAGLSPGQLYRCYPTKESIIEAIAAERLSELAMRAAVLAADEKQDFPATLAGWAEEAFLATVADPGEVAFGAEILAETFRNPAVAAVAAKYDRIHAPGAFGTLIRRGQNSGWIDRALQSELAATLLVGAFDALCRAAVLQPALDRRQAARQLRLLVTRLLEIRS